MTHILQPQTIWWRRNSEFSVLFVNVVGGFQNMSEELCSRYEMPRGLPANRGPRALTPDEGRQGHLRQIASSFNPQMNYGGIMSQRRPWRRQVHMHKVQDHDMYDYQFGRVQQRCHNLLPSPSRRKVPRGSDKAQL